MKDLDKQFSWLQSMSRDILENDTVPLLGQPPPFPWQEMSEQLLSSLNISVEINNAPKWLPANNFSNNHQQHITITLPPLEGLMFWVMDKDDVDTVIAWSLKQKNDALQLCDKEIKQGLYDYLIVHVMHIIDKLNAIDNIHPRLTENTSIPDEDVLCYDVSVHFEEKSVVGQLVISSELQQSWCQHFAKPLQSIDNTTTNNLSIELGVNIGNSTFNEKQLQELSPGDVIIFDNCTIDPDQQTGDVTIENNGNIIMHGSLSPEGITIK